MPPIVKRRRAVNTAAKRIVNVSLNKSTVGLKQFAPTNSYITRLAIPAPRPSAPRTMIRTVTTTVTALSPRRRTVTIKLNAPNPTSTAKQVTHITVGLTN